MIETNDLMGRFEDMPASVYHARRDYLGSSSLAEMRRSPLHFKEAWENPKEPTESMKRGTFLHDVILAQDLAPYVARPLKPDGTLVRANSNEYKEWAEANQDRIIVDPDDLAAIEEIRASVQAHAVFMDLARQCKAEVSFFNVSQTGQKIKARCDLVPDDPTFIIDVKTCSNIDKFERDLFAMAYDVRLIHYAETISDRNPIYMDFYYLAVESSRPFGCKLFKLDRHDVESAQQTWNQWMNTVRVCREDDRWPGYSQEIITARKPVFAATPEEPSFDF